MAHEKGSFGHENTMKPHEFSGVYFHLKGRGRWGSLSLGCKDSLALQN